MVQRFDRYGLLGGCPSAPRRVLGTVEQLSSMIGCLRHHQRRWAVSNLGRIMQYIQFFTPRLTVRPLCLDDYADVAGTSRNSLLSEEERSGNLLSISQRDSVSFARMISFRSEAARCGTLYVSGIFLSGARDFVGDVLLCDFEGGSTPSAHCGLVVASQFRGRGFGTEIMKGLLVNQHRSGTPVQVWPKW